MELKGFGLLIIVASLGALAMALIGQYAFGLYPCTLCIYQRVPFVVAAVLGGVSMFYYTRPALFLCGITFTVGTAIAAYHVGVEQAWWENIAGCSFDTSDSSIEAIREQILNGPRALCTDVAWSLFGVSMAGYNVLFSAMMAVIAFVGASRPR